MVRLRDQLRSDPYTLSMIKQNNPSFADAILSDNITVFAEMVDKQESQKRDLEV